MQPDRAVIEAIKAWTPPPRLDLADWADRFFVLSAESAAEPGRWKTLPYQREILNAFTDPDIERVTLMKSARVGYTKALDIVVRSLATCRRASVLANHSSRHRPRHRGHRRSRPRDDECLSPGLVGL